MKKYILIVAVLVVCTAAFLAFRPQEYDRSVSPDGKYVAVAKYHAFRSWIPMMSGSSGDKPGWITLSTQEGRFIGSRNLEMVSFIRDIQWTDHSAEIHLVGAWQLN